MCFVLLDLDCLYKYTKQLFHHPSCEPYTLGIMKLECIAEVPHNASDISIGWFLDSVELNNDSHVAISAHVQCPNNICRIRSRLTISPISDEYAGDYACNLLGDEQYIASDIFRLRNSRYYEIFSPLGYCHNGDVFAHIEPANEKCADFMEGTVSMSLNYAEPPATTSFDTPVTSTPLIYKSPPTNTPLPQGRPTFSICWVLGITVVMIIVLVAVCGGLQCVVQKKTVAVDEQTLRRESLDLCVRVMYICICLHVHVCMLSKPSCGVFSDTFVQQ